MSNIYVYPSGYVDGVLLDDSQTDFSTAGLVGALSPTSCTFREIRNNERSIEIEHPVDAEGRYKALVKGYILSIKVPVMTVPATGDSPIDINWQGTRTDYPSNPTQGYAFYLHSDDEETIDVNYYYAAAGLNAWRNGSSNIYTVGTYPVVGDTVYILNSSNNATVRGTVKEITKNTTGESVTSITIKPNTGSDSKRYSRSANYDREINGMWYKFATDNMPIIWKGELYYEPANPQINWAYKDLNDGFTYYYSEDLEWTRICDTSKVGQVWKYRVKSSYADKKKPRTVYKKKKKGGKLVVLKSGDEVFVLEKDEKEDKRWKVRTPRNGDGYMLPEALELVQGGEYDIRDNWKIIQDVVSPWSITTQLFRIYKVTKSISSVKVEARDVAYDCLNNIYSSSYAGSITLAQMVKSLKTDTFGALSGHGSGYDLINFSTPDGYLMDNITKNEYRGKTLTEVMVGESSGICAKFNVIRVVDNYDVYFIKDPGINRGFTIQYGKNMTGVDYEINDDEIYTAVIPVGKNKKGDPLYLGPQKSKDAKKNYIGWAGNIIWSVNKDKYPTKRFYVLECDVQAKSDKTAEIDYAMDQMRYLAESKIHAADKKTNAQDGDMDEPKITVTVEFINLGDTEEYKQFKNLEKCFLHDYVTIRHPDLGIDVTARVTEMEWDCLLDRMNKITLGNVKENEGRAAQYDAHQAQRAAYLAEQLGLNAYEQASDKRRVFTDGVPVPPYDVGDLWITENKDLMVCVTAKDIDDEYSEDDWEIATKYTDTGLEWKGTFADVEELIEEYGDPVDGWAYRNSTDKKAYYYQNGSWNIVTEDGLNGLNIATVTLYKRSATTPTKPSITLTYTFSTGELTPASGLSGWSQSIPTADGNPCYSIQKTAISNTDIFEILPGAWSDQIVAFDNGADGEDGQDGHDGSNGKSIGTVTNYYLATNASSGVTRSTSGWTTGVQSVSSSKKYLWNYELIKYSDGTQAAVTDPCIIGSYGRDGINGTNGTDGKGITSIVEKYQISASASTAPTTWLDSPPAMTTAKPYLWNYEITRYTTGNPTETVPRVIGAYGKSVVGTTHYYKLSETQPQPPNISASGWVTTEPSYTPGNTDKLWHCVKTSYSDGSSSYSPVSEAYSNTKIDTFIATDSSGNTFFKNSANNASVCIDSVAPAVVLGIIENGALVPLAKFEKNAIIFGQNGYLYRALSIVDMDNLNPVVAIGIDPDSLADWEQTVNLGTTVSSGIFVDRDAEDLSLAIYNPEYEGTLGNFKLWFNSSEARDYVLTTSKPDNWDSEYYTYFTKSGSTYSPIVAASAPVWTENKYYENEGNVWGSSRVEIRENGQIVELSGQIAPISTISGSTALVKILHLPESLAPDKEYNFVCQGSTTCVWMLRVDISGGVWFSRYRNGSSYASCSPSNWLPFNVSWMRTIPTWEQH